MKHLAQAINLLGQDVSQLPLQINVRRFAYNKYNKEHVVEWTREFKSWKNLHAFLDEIKWSSEDEGMELGINIWSSPNAVNKRSGTWYVDIKTVKDRDVAY